MNHGVTQKSLDTSHGVIQIDAVTRDGHDDDERDEGEGDEREEGSSRRRPRGAAPKERVLHTRVPAVLDQELKRLAHSLRVPVSNVVRAILEDAVDAVDTVSERTESELLGFVQRLARQRDELRSRVRARPGEDEGEVEDAEEVPAERAREDEARASCPERAPELLDGVFGYQPLVLAADTECSVCGRTLPAGSEAHRALFDDPSKRVFLGADCRLVPARK